MMTNFLAVIMACCIVLQVSGETVKESLFRDLTEDYEPAVDPGNIDLKIKIYLICSWQDSSTGFVVSNVWESHEWIDERLAWDPDEYGGLDKLLVPSKYVWTPDVNVDEKSTATKAERDHHGVYVELWYDGKVNWYPRVTYRVACAENDSKIICGMTIGSWTYDGHNVNLQIDEDVDGAPVGVDLELYNSACPLEVESHTEKIVTHTYTCYSDMPFQMMDVTVTYTKQHTKQPTMSTNV